MTGQLTWLVTGCSSGLGEALARAALAKGDQVIATARASKGVNGAERLSALKEAGAAVLELDVAAPPAKLAEIAQTAWNIYGQIDVLVNNAGYVDSAVVEETDEDFIVNVLHTNTLGPLNLTRALLPLMRARRTGTLLFVSSVGTYFAAPGSGIYSGSKGLIEALVPNLALEVASFGIRTSILVFGFFRTAVFTPGHMFVRAPNPLPEYAELNALMKGYGAAVSGTEPGDPKKGSELVVEAVRGEGRCEGKELPLRLPVGSDAFKFVRDDCVEKMRICDEWESITSQTDCD